MKLRRPSAGSGSRKTKLASHSFRTRRSALLIGKPEPMHSPLVDTGLFAWALRNRSISMSHAGFVSSDGFPSSSRRWVRRITAIRALAAAAANMLPVWPRRPTPLSLRSKNAASRAGLHSLRPCRIAWQLWRATMICSRISTPSVCPRLTRASVARISSLLGLASPLGWLCASTIALASSANARRKMALGLKSRWTAEPCCTCSCAISIWLLSRYVRRQNIWHNSRRRLAECGPRLGVGFRRRACGVASADVRWCVA